MGFNSNRRNQDSDLARPEDPSQTGGPGIEESLNDPAYAIPGDMSEEDIGRMIEGYMGTPPTISEWQTYWRHLHG